MSSSDDAIDLALKTRTLPEGITAVLVEARKTLSHGPNGAKGFFVLWGNVYLREGIPDGTEICTSLILEESTLKTSGNGSVPTIRTRNSTYLVRWAKTSVKELKEEMEQDARG